MKQNPVYKREARVNVRSIRLPMIVMVFNGILSAVALLNMYSVMAQVRASASIQYTSFMQMYELLAALEFIMLLFIVPALTAASISGERERQTLDLMLTTLLTPAQIVSGKLMSARSVMVLLVVSSFPPISMVLVFGGITWMDLAALLLCYVAVALVAGSMGIFFSAVFKRSTLASVCTYGVIGLLVAGTYFANRFAMALSSTHLSRYGGAVRAAGEMARPTAGAAFYLLLLNPAATFYTVMNGPAESGMGIESMCRAMGVQFKGWIMEHWVFTSIVLQLALSGVLLFFAVRCVDPIKKKRLRPEEKKTAV